MSPNCIRFFMVIQGYGLSVWGDWQTGLGAGIGNYIWFLYYFIGLFGSKCLTTRFRNLLNSTTFNWIEIITTKRQLEPPGLKPAINPSHLNKLIKTLLSVIKIYLQIESKRFSKFGCEYIGKRKRSQCEPKYIIILNSCWPSPFRPLRKSLPFDQSWTRINSQILNTNVGHR